MSDATDDALADRAEAPDEGDPDQTPPRGRRWLGILVRAALIVVVVLVAGIGVGAYWLRAHLPELVRAEVVRRALAMGIEIESANIEPHNVLPWEDGPQDVVLTDLVAKVRAAPDCEITADRATIKLENREPLSAELVAMRVRAPRVSALVALMKVGESGPLQAIPFESRDVRVSLGSVAPAVPVSVDLGIGHVASKDGAVGLEGLKAELTLPVVGVHLGPLELELERKPHASVIRPATPKGVTLELDDEATKLSIRLEGVRAIALRPLMKIALPDVGIDGSIDLDVGKTLAPSATFDVTLSGYTPPHPPELAGIVFGDQTRARGSAKLVSTKLVLDDVSLSAGSLTLKGKGEAELLGDHALTLDLAGSIGCAELATSAVGAHLGWGGTVIASRLTSGRLTGTVGVTVKVDATLDDLEHAKAIPSATVRCGVKL